MTRRVFSIAVLCGLAWCGMATAASPPLRRPALLRWLRAGGYLTSYRGEPAVHVSAGPHGGFVRTWYAPVLADDLAAGRTTFRAGAAMVKELYLDRPDGPPAGYSVMRKLTARSRGGRGWLFFETFDARTGAGFYGRGLGVCTGCHAAGTDFLLSDFRP